MEYFGINEEKKNSVLGCVVKVIKFKFRKVVNSFSDYLSRLVLKDDVWWNKVYVVSEDWGRMNLEKRKKVEEND